MGMGCLVLVVMGVSLPAAGWWFASAAAEKRLQEALAAQEAAAAEAFGAVQGKLEADAGPSYDIDKTVG
jgi:hypothetical protein